jgi:hypothetical protein
VKSGWPLCLQAALVWLAVLPVGAQDATDVAPPPSARFPAAWYPPDNNVTSTMPPDKGAPYVARAVQRSEQNGAAAVEPAPMQARDSAGRTRTETAMGPRTAQDGTQVQVREVGISDPVSHCSFQWEEPWVIQNSPPTATVQCMPRTLHYSAQSTWSSVASMKAGKEHPSPDETDNTEAIGERTIDGVRAVGFRRVRVIENTHPEQSQRIESEVWISAEMKEIVAISVKGAMGYSIELHEIQLREPDAKLFYPPANYKIQPISSHP